MYCVGGTGAIIFLSLTPLGFGGKSLYVLLFHFLLFPSLYSLTVPFFQSLQQHREAQDSSTPEGQTAKRLASTQSPHAHMERGSRRRRAPISIPAAIASVLLARGLAEAAVDGDGTAVSVRRHLAGHGARAARGGAHGAAQRAGVLARGVLGSAWMVLATGAAAGGVGAAVGDALVAPGGAEPVRERVAVLRNVRGQPVIAHA